MNWEKFKFTAEWMLHLEFKTFPTTSITQSGIKSTVEAEEPKMGYTCKNHGI